jgi:NADH-quinone oxidoreductase subunit N
MGKFYLFAAVLEAGLTGLVVVAVINTVISAAYYLGVVRVMYFEKAPAGLAGEGPARRPLLAITTWAAALATVALGLFPAPLLSLAEAVVASIGQGP